VPALLRVGVGAEFAEGLPQPPSERVAQAMRKSAAKPGSLRRRSEKMSEKANVAAGMMDQSGAFLLACAVVE